jgi:hypothetical protein
MLRPFESFMDDTGMLSKTKKGSLWYNMLLYFGLPNAPMIHLRFNLRFFEKP